MDGRVNIMSVEFAIEREVAYREKVANLMPPSKMNTLKHFSTLQIPSSGQLLGPRQQDPEPSQSSVPNPSYPGPSLNMNRAPMPQPRPYRTSTRQRHFGIKRKATSSHHRQPPPPPQSGIISIDQHGIFFCKVCEVSCTGPDNLKSHIRGSKHKSKWQQLQMAGNSAIPPGQQGLQCELCGIFCSDQNGLEMHFKGQKHKAKVQEMQSGSKKGEETGKPWCELCQIWCMNEDSFQQHLKGQKHIARSRG